MLALHDQLQTEQVKLRLQGGALQKQIKIAEARTAALPQGVGYKDSIPIVESSSVSAGGTTSTLHNCDKEVSGADGMEF